MDIIKQIQISALQRPDIIEGDLIMALVPRPGHCRCYERNDLPILFGKCSNLVICNGTNLHHLVLSLKEC